MTSHRAGRIEGLDGLRALAVIAVVGFHLWPGVVPGGFVGVDVFFVISGFLITTLLIRERRATGRIDLLQFWTRRARRLLPALVLVLVATIGSARLVNIELLVNIERQVLGAVTFSTNWLEIAAGSDYFNHTSPSLFVTFWSLAVEEQFYLVWPLVFVLLGLIGASARQSAHLALVAGLGSALLMVISYRSGQSPTRAYYGTHTHAFGLMIGVSLAFAFGAPVRLLHRRGWEQLRSWIGFVAVAGLAALVVVLSSDSPLTYQGGLLLASLCSAVMVAALPGGSSPYQSLLRIRPLAWTGERSYGLYLWHWPVLLIVSELLPPTQPGSDANWQTAVLTIGATLVLTEASYRWIEMPVRRLGFGGSLSAFAGWLNSKTSWTEWMWRFAAGSVAAVLVAAAVVGFATAPDRSQEQQSVEAGARLIQAQQESLSSVAVPASTEATGQIDTQAEAVSALELFGRSQTPSGPSLLPRDGAADPAAQIEDWAGEPELQVDDQAEAGTAPEPDTDAPTSEPWVPSGDRITGIGDSVLSGVAPAMYERFPGIYLEATPILQWRDAPAIVDRLLAEGAMRDIVVMNFGTNAGLESETSRQSLRNVLEALGPTRRVVLVNVVGISHWIPSTNATMAEISADYPNTIVADWHRVIQANPGLLHRDKTHPNMEGIAVYADLVATALEELGSG